MGCVRSGDDGKRDFARVLHNVLVSQSIYRCSTIKTHRVSNNSYSQVPMPHLPMGPSTHQKDLYHR